MKIELLRTLEDPNLYSDKPVLLVVLEPDAASARAVSSEVLARVDRLVPSIEGRADAWNDASILLREGMSSVELLECLLVEMLRLAGVEARSVRALTARDPFRHGLAVVYTAERATRFLAEAAVELVNALLSGDAFAL